MIRRYPGLGAPVHHLHPRARATTLCGLPVLLAYPGRDPACPACLAIAWARFAGFFVVLTGPRAQA